jgi:hypothetical protein
MPTKKLTRSMAVLLCIEQAGGTADYERLYADFPSVIELPAHLLAEWGGRLMYKHHVRKYASNLCKEGDLTRLRDGVFRITERGRSKLQKWKNESPEWRNRHR